MATLSFDIAGSQIDGARDYQEDAFLITRLGDSDSDSAGSLVIVADGMGGHAAGNVASNMAVQNFNRHISKNYPNEDVSNALYEAVLQANGSITATVAETAALKGMGCTLVACVLEQNELRWVSVGDSHLYLLRDGQLSKRNADHSYGGFLDRMAAAGTPVEAEAGFSRNMLMSALTGDDIAEIDCPAEPLVLTSGDRVILSSDGLDTLAAETIVEICTGAQTAKQCVEALLQGVTDAGAPRQDNTTVIVVDVIEKAEAAPVEPPPPPAATDLDPTQPDAAAPADEPAFVVDDTPPRKNPLPLVAAVVVGLAVLGGAGFWFMNRDAAPPPPPLVVDSEAPASADDDLVEMDAVEDDTISAGQVAPEAQPPATTPAEPAIASGPTGQFSDTLKSGGKGPLMVWLPGGRFTMGGRLPTDDPDEFPAHAVTVQPFAMSVNEVTVAEYKRFARATGTRLPNLGGVAGSDEANFPMFFVSWNDALAYTQWLSQQTGHEYTLPSEAQWEYAARAGAESDYPWGRNLGRGNAHCIACDTGLDPRQPTAIGRFNANRFGLYDMAGNVQEWVYDCYHPNYDAAPTDGSVYEGGDCTVRVLRGGGYGSGPRKLRSAARDKFRFDKGNDQTGIRVVRVR
ncbi:MAG: SUMF1/EgtB/PvdO family nonheme iron enzyme [Gammaproteobacteria bacterium]|nr:SUMF1/EgtB/PvdO family nonheme iron enzyme [Gammaproteobacteria bacterium]